ncbi:MAG: hypothetical protein HGB12_12505, partial [Bacteroidetes bacterium]|nr:hypothetical protein [Bacteroidota bacterium]
EEDYETDTDSTTNELIKLFAPMIASKFTKSPNSVSPTMAETITSTQIPNTQPTEKQNISDENLMQIWQNTPMMAKTFAKKSSDENLENMLRAQMPNVSDDTVKRAIAIIRKN